LHIAVILMGFNAVWLQVFLIRELLVTFSGNELVIGIFLANWLLLTAIGSFLSSRSGSGSYDPAFVITIMQVLIAVIFPVVLYLVRTIKYQIGIIPGEGIGLHLLFMVSFALTLPLGFLVGFQFGYACRLINSIIHQPAQAVSRAYFLESVGSMTGGLLLGQIFMLKFHGFIGAAIIALLNVAIALLLVYKSSDRKIWRAILFILFITGITGVITGVPGFVNHLSRQHQWQDYRLIAEGNSVYGHAALLAYRDQLIMVSNGVPVATFPASNLGHSEDLIHLPLLDHPKPDRVLMIGGALGGPLNELVKHPVKKIDYVDLDPLLIELMQKYIPDTLFLPFKDLRIQSHFTDARYFLRNSKQKYDLILLNLPEPSSLELNRFYTSEFFDLCRSRMSGGGILAFTLPGSISSMSKALCQLNNTIESAVRKHFPRLRIFPDIYNLFICSDTTGGGQTTIDQMEARRLNRKLQTRLISDAYLKIKSDSLRKNWFTAQIMDCPVGSVNEDLKPVAVFYSLLYWNSMHAPLLGEMLTWFDKTGIMPFFLLPVLIFGSLIIYFRKSARLGSIALISAVCGTGFMGMGVTVILVLLFQSTFGYIYHWIGFLLAAFMAGLAAGSWLMESWGKNLTIRWKFTLLEIWVILYLVIMLLGMQVTTLSELIPGMMQLIFIALFLICGYLVGAEFAVAAGQITHAEGMVARSGGVIYAADLIGAWFGGMTITVICVPVFGIPHTIAFLVVLKLITLLFYLFAQFRKF